MAGTKLRIFQLNRTGIELFEGHVDIKDDPETFLKFIASLSFASPEKLGQGKPLDDINGVRIQCEWNKPSRRPNAEVLDSRGTTCVGG